MACLATEPSVLSTSSKQDRELIQDNVDLLGGQNDNVGGDNYDDDDDKLLLVDFTSQQHTERNNT